MSPLNSVLLSIQPGIAFLCGEISKNTYCFDNLTNTRLTQITLNTETGIRQNHTNFLLCNFYTCGEIFKLKTKLGFIGALQSAN